MTVACVGVWSVGEEAVDSEAAAALLRAYFTEMVERYNGRPAGADEVDAAMAEDPSTGLAAFLVLRAHGAPAGCAGLRPDGELTRVYVAPPFRRRGGACALLRAVEDTARARGLDRIRLDTRTDLVEARALYTATGYDEVAPFSAGPYAEHWFEKRL